VLDLVVDYQIANPAHDAPMGEVCLSFPLDEESDAKSAARSLAKRGLLFHRQMRDYESFSATPEGLLASHRAADVERVGSELLRVFHARIAELRTKFERFKLGELTLTGPDDIALAQLVVCAFELHGHLPGVARRPGPETDFLTPDNVVDLRGVKDVGGLLDRVRRMRAARSEFLRGIGGARGRRGPGREEYPDDELDDLLPLLGRKALNRDLARLSGQEGPCPLCATVMIDVDHFKAVNDSLGHDAGDDVLKRVAGIVRAVTEGRGSGYRYGGEELVLLLPNFTAEEAFPLVERIRRAVEAEVWRDRGGLHVTISAGIDDTETTDATTALRNADAAMYAAKDGGRNRTERAPKEVGAVHPTGAHTGS